jgi:hypothetical protein
MSLEARKREGAVGFKIVAIALLLAAWMAGSAAAADRADHKVPWPKPRTLSAAAGSSFSVTVRVRNVSRNRAARRSVTIPSIGVMLVAGGTVTGYDTAAITLGNAGQGGAAPGGHAGATGKRAFTAQS